MALSTILQNPRTINKIEPVDTVLLDPPTGITNGYRVLVADTIAGDHDGAIGIGAFLGNEGKVAVSDGTGGWGFEDSALYLDNQLVQVRESREVWIYWDDRDIFERAVTLRSQYHEYMGYLRNQDGNPIYTWTQHTLTGSAIVPQVNSQDFTLSAGYVYTIRHRIIATRSASQDVGVGLFIDGVEAGNDFYGSNANNYTGSGTFEYRIKIPDGAADKTLNFQDLTGTATDNHDAVLSIEANAIDGSSVLPKADIEKELAFVHYFATNGTNNVPMNNIIRMNTIGITANNLGVVEADLQEDFGPGNYTKLPYTGDIVVTAQAWNTSTIDQRLMLVHEASDGRLKRQWGNFLTTLPSRASNTTTMFDVEAGDRIFLESLTPFDYEEGLALTEIGISYHKFI